MRTRQPASPLSIAKPELAYAHILSVTEFLVFFTSTNHQDTALKPRLSERSRRHLLNAVNRVSTFEFGQILELSQIGYFQSKTIVSHSSSHEHSVSPIFEYLKCFDFDQILYVAFTLPLTKPKRLK